MPEAMRRVAPFYCDLADPPAAVARLFAASAMDDFFRSLAWFRTLAGAGFPADTEPRVYIAGSPEAQAGLVLCSSPPALKSFRVRTLRSLTNFYSCRYASLLQEPSQPAAIAAVIDRLVAERPKWDMIDLDSLDHDGSDFAALSQAFRSHGWPTQSYFHFGNWFETTAGMTAADYFAARPGQLRNTLKRHANKLAKSASSAFRIFTREDEAEEAIGLYEQVYAQSWKGSEPFPAFAATLISATAALGCLRLGVMTIDQVPAAAQIWIVWNGKATIFKLAHDERFTALSPGSLLTRHVMEQVLSEGNLREVDFGRGDDPYKRLWLPRRRERWGLVAFNPTTVRGRAAALRHLGPPAVRRGLTRIRERLGRTS
jgi:hypothetical protein